MAACKHDGMVTIVGDDEGIRCSDCGRMICNEEVRGDLRSPNGKRSLFRPDFCGRTATLIASWRDVMSRERHVYVCQRHARRIRWFKPVAFANEPVLAQEAR